MPRYSAQMHLTYKASILTPGRTLDQHVSIWCCDCAYERDCKYMDITAERLAEQHEERYGHTVTVVRTPAEPLTVQMIQTRLQKRIHPKREIVDTQPL